MRTKLVTVEEAAAMIRDEDLLAFTASGPTMSPTLIFKAVVDRFEKEGSPKNLTVYHASGISSVPGDPEGLINRWANTGIVGRLISGHIEMMRPYHQQILNNEIEAYNIPQGTLAINLDHAARRVPGFFTKIGLYTCVDPRVEGVGLNEISKNEYYTAQEVDGEDYLFVKTIFPTVCVLRGTTADVNGNVTGEKENVFMDTLTMAQAVKNNGGRVIVQVERLSDSHANPKQVLIPWQFIDAIYVDPNQVISTNSLVTDFAAGLTGDIYYPKPQLQAMVAAHQGTEEEITPGMNADRVVARRAALLLRKGDVVNLGIGIPTGIGAELSSMDHLTTDDVTMTVELGVLGGTPIHRRAFGMVVNSDVVYGHTSMFNFYEGGGLNITFVGALEFDQAGNTNVTRVGDKLAGLGGFTHVSQTPDRVVFCSKFMQGSGYHRDGDNWSPVDGKFCKLVEQVEHISYSSKMAKINNQEAWYITERAVFKRGEDGLELVEVSPYVDLEKDVLAHLPAGVKVGKDIKTIPPACFDFES